MAVVIRVRPADLFLLKGLKTELALYSSKSPTSFKVPSHNWFHHSIHVYVYMLSIYKYLHKHNGKAALETDHNWEKYIY